MKFLQTILAVFILLISSSCDQQKPTVHPTDNRQIAIEKTIKKYNSFLADCYRALNTKALHQVASTKMVDTTYFHMTAIGEAGVKMDCRLKKITFDQLTEIAPDTVTIAAQEEWDYTYWDIKTGKRLFDNSVTYNLTYTLEQKSEKWLVTEVSVQKTTEDKDSSFIFQRPANQKPGGNAK